MNWNTLPEKILRASRFEKNPWIRKIIVTLAGGLVLFIGILMIVLPGPAILVIPAGLTILATEYPWAKKYVDWIKSFIQTHIVTRMRNRKKQSSNFTKPDSFH